MDIGLQQITKSEIYQKIEPPFEDLFDPAEEYILTLLLDPWIKMVEQDREIYGQVGLMEETRQLDSVHFRKLQALREESISKKGEDLAVEGEVSSRLDSTKVAKRSSQVLEELAPYSLNDLIRNRLNLEQFRSFLEQHSASRDLLCWIDIEQFRRMLHKDKEQREEKLKEIKNKYLNKKYFFGPDSPATKEEQDQIMKLGGGWGQILHERVPPLILLEVQKFVQMRLEKKWLPQFLTSEGSGLQKKPKPYLQDAAEDVLLQTKEKKKELWKQVDNKWVSSSKEIITFRKALLNPVTAFQFQRFVALKGDLLENGVLFWLEVQKYKDMCHSHCDDGIIQNKITTIINCFINSSLPPALQIDIPEEQAQKIIAHRKELGPYVFREAQMTIFALLFKFWPKFCEFRANLADESGILTALDKRKEKKQELLKRSKEEEKLQRMKSAMSTKLTDSPASEGKVTKGELSSTQSFSGFGRQVSWTYSKYLEAIQQERVLLKIQEDLEKKSLASSAYTGATNIFSLRSDRPVVSERSGTPSPFRTAFVRQQRSPLPKDK